MLTSAKRKVNWLGLQNWRNNYQQSVLLHLRQQKATQDQHFLNSNLAIKGTQIGSVLSWIKWESCQVSMLAQAKGITKELGWQLRARESTLLPSSVWDPNPSSRDTTRPGIQARGIPQEVVWSGYPPLPISGAGWHQKEGSCHDKDPGWEALLFCLHLILLPYWETKGIWRHGQRGFHHN